MIPSGFDLKIRLTKSRRVTSIIRRHLARIPNQKHPSGIVRDRTRCDTAYCGERLSVRLCCLLKERDDPGGETFVLRLPRKGLAGACFHFPIN